MDYDLPNSDNLQLVEIEESFTRQNQFFYKIFSIKLYP